MKTWIFFDIGSTLVDETVCEQKRILQTISGSNVEYDDFYNTMCCFAAENQNAYKLACEKFRLAKVPWCSEFETLYSDTVMALRYLKSGYKIGVIANQNIGLSKRLEALGILDFFDLIISSSDVGVSKPDKAIFKIAIARSACCPDEAYMIGDRLDNDIIPAQAIGMKTVWVRQGFEGMGSVSKLSTKPTYIVENLSELQKLF